MQHLLRFLKPYWKECILGPFFKLLEAIFELIVPVVMAKIIDNGIAQGDGSYVIRMSGVIVLLGVFGLAFALTCQYFAAKCAYKFGADLRMSLYKHINSFSCTELDRFGSSTLINRMVADTNSAQTGVNMFIRLAVRAPFLIVGAIIMALLIDVRLSLIFLVIAPIVALLLFFVMNRTVPMYRTNQTKLDAIARRLGENLDGMRVIRAFSRQKQEKAAFAEECDDLEQSMLAVGRISAILNPLTFMIMNLGIVAVIWFGGVQIDAGGLTQGELTAFTNYMTQILLAMVVMANLIVILTKAQASALRIHDVFSVNPSMENGTAVPDCSCEEAVAFSHVDFSYAGAGDNSLDDISFTLKTGQTLGIIGGTGSGKSTLVNLIPRLYDAAKGEVRVFGKPVREYDMAALRRVIGVVPQKVQLFSGTLFWNLRWADENVHEDDVWDALEIAQASQFVQDKGQSLDLQVMQSGRNFSGGQRQRLAIARALAGNPSILILDDSTSALDYATDAALRTALRERRSNLTTIMISQRATSLIHADLILVMDDGRCVGKGTHEELLATCEEYREIYNSQMN